MNLDFPSPPSGNDMDTADMPMLRKQARAWAIKLKTGRPSADDVAEFQLWRGQSPAHAQAWSAAARDWKTVDETTQAFAALRRPRAARPDAPRRGRRLFLGAAASAFGTLAVVGILRPPMGLWPSWSELRADYRTGTGEQRAVSLGQNVSMSLNTQTSIAVAHRGGVQRISLIAGEAAVSAYSAACELLAEDSRLVMSDADVEIRRLAHGRVRVRCRRGEAELRHPARAVALAAGQQLIYDRRQAGTPTALPAQDDAWRQGIVVFDNMPLADAVEEINRYRPGRVVLLDSAAANRRFSARLKIAALDEAIDLLEAVHHVRVRRVGDLVLLG
ncbi:FecR family protein [Pollutimonas bauzanensis]|uniref:FecR family protein n=1 Tax=Pollutimonas bauzanensis TaxID=658167 RepID=A0A1M6BD43_9BURK|nr:DUF4880 domain-containing protein [Pollutimonas bauzanensis]SHI46651.1 FecR family protein [Pollutimonas bauzanensis]